MWREILKTIGRNKFKIYSLLFVSVWFTGDVLVAQKLYFENITAKQGLSQNSVTSIIQDRTGFIWFGTYDGLSRYDGYTFKVFRKEANQPHSLSHNFIRTMLLDRKGQLWIGTLGGGISLYDADHEHFITYMHSELDKNSISNNEIYRIVEDRSGTIWIATWGGGLNKVVFNPENKDTSLFAENRLQFIRFQNNPSDPQSLITDKVSSLIQDRNGLLWIGTRYGISIFDPEKELFVRHYRHDPENPNSLSHDNVSALELDSHGDIWIATWGGGLNKYDLDSDRFIRFQYNPNDPQSISHNMLISLSIDRSGNLWIGSWGGGLYRLDSKELEKTHNSGKPSFTRYLHYPNEMQSISGNSIYCIYEDRTNVLWIGTDWNGLSKFNPDNNQFTLYQSEEDKPSVNDNTVFTIYKDRKGVLWLGTRSGGLNSYNPKSGQYAHYLYEADNPNSISNNAIRSIYEDRSGRLWIGTEVGLNLFNRTSKKFYRYYNQPADPTMTNVFSILEDKAGFLWIGNWGGGLSRFDPNTGKFITYEPEADNLLSINNNIIWCMLEDQYNQLWIGTDQGGLNKYDRTNDCFFHYTHNSKDSTSLSDNKVISLFQSRDGTIWAGTTTGLNRMIGGGNPDLPVRFKCYNTEDGLYNNTVQGIVEDDQGNLWLINGEYLTFFNPVTRQLRGYHVSDKLKIEQFSVNAIFKDKTNGEIYIGGTNGFCVFHPDSIYYNRFIPDIVITDLRIFNKSVPIGQPVAGRQILAESIISTDHLYLDYTDDVIAFEFTALHFNSPENNKFAFKLEGFEQEWNYTDARQRVATYTNLDPGEYIFRAKASNNDGIWNAEGISLAISIKPPFWGTWWFRLFSVLALLLMIIAAIRIRTRKITFRNRELANINLRLSKEINERHRAEQEVKKLNTELEQRVQERTLELRNSNLELESFAYSISHDLRTPLRGMQGFSYTLLEEYSTKLDEKGRDYLRRIIRATRHMAQLIDDLLKLSRVTRSVTKKQSINLSQMAERIMETLKSESPERKVTVDIEKNLEVVGDYNLIYVALENLLYNAWKFSSSKKVAKIEFGKMIKDNGPVYYIKDNGVGFDMKYMDKLFEPFHRQHLDYEGTGIGLATVKRILGRHNGEVWAEGRVNRGATFYFTIGIAN
ncbi:MAG: hypothetical protein JXB44_11725 [Calditrichaceae bacterium]|nr:hypothetical protein [Calditrichaceae bacterium]RQV93489.1 MAG: histidine kinase [Calditrichota bacterium]